MNVNCSQLTKWDINSIKFQCVYSLSIAVIDGSLPCIEVILLLSLHVINRWVDIIHRHNPLHRYTIYSNVARNNLSLQDTLTRLRYWCDDIEKVLLFLRLYVHVMYCVLNTEWILKAEYIRANEHCTSFANVPLPPCTMHRLPSVQPPFVVSYAWIVRCMSENKAVEEQQGTLLDMDGTYKWQG